MTHPIDEALDAKEKTAAARNQKDLELWEQWKSDPTPDKIHPLMQRFERDFKNKTREWKAPNTNEAAMKADMKVHAIKAWETYAPDKGASLRTHTFNYIQKSKRFNAKHQNRFRIPEPLTYQIGPINRAKDELKEDLGREATPVEISEFLNPMMSPRKQLTPESVVRIQEMQRADLTASSLEEATGSEVAAYAGTQERQIVKLLRPTLTPDQQMVYDHLYGVNGKKQISSTSALAKEIGKSPSQVSRLRTGILKQFERYNK